MSFDFDVVVVGGGPIGSTLAYELSKNGFSVCILEKKKEVGIPLQCAGIVSKRIKELNEIPENLILNEIKGAFLHSPNHIINVKKNHIEAFVIDRIAYDKFLAKRAIDNGIKFFNNHKVNYLDHEKGIIGFNDKKIKAKIIVGADGSNSFVSKTINNRTKCFNGSQFLIRLANNEKNKIQNDFNHLDSDFVDLFVNSKTLPGFIWSIPVSNNNNYNNNYINLNNNYNNLNKNNNNYNNYRVGFFSNDSYKEQNEFILNFLENNEKFKNYEIIEKYHGKIPIYDKEKKLVYQRAILIGDAASQLKPTTGGGLILGFEVVEIAKKYITKSINDNNISILKEYEETFRKKYSKELNYQIKVQNTLEKLSDDDLDYMFHKLKEKNIDKIISEYGDMDKQSILVKEILKRGLIFTILPSLIFKKVSKIWNI